MKCKGCGFPFPPHELRGEECPECVWKRLERVEREATAMREALKDSHPARVWDLARQHYSGVLDVKPDCITEWHKENCKKVDSALSTDTGANYISKESVKPLVEALNESAQCRFFYMESMDIDDDAKDRVMQALAHARTLGL